MRHSPWVVVSDHPTTASPKLIGDAMSPPLAPVGRRSPYGRPVTTVRTRREPPRFRRVEVVRVDPQGPRMVRVTLTGAELGGLDIGLPAASIRILLPRPLSDEVVLPVWNGNEFLDEDGSRPVIRTVTPLGFDTERLELAVESSSTATDHSRGGPAGLGPATAPPSRGRDGATRSTRRLPRSSWPATSRRCPPSACCSTCCPPQPRWRRSSRSPIPRDVGSSGHVLAWP